MMNIQVSQWSDAHYASNSQLPRLKMTEEITRRDSITSSKTGDSGYHSDPEISLSPLDFRGQLYFPEAGSPTTPSFSALVLEANDVPAQLPSSYLTPGHALKRSYTSILLSNSKCPTTVTPTRPQITSAPGSYCDPSPRNSESPNCKNVLGTTESSEEEPSQALVDIRSVKQEKPSGSVNILTEVRKSSIVSNSTTASGGDYSTDDSESEADSDSNPMLSRATLTTIELILRKIELILRQAAYVQCVGGSTARAGANTDVNRSRRGSAQGGAAKRRLKPDDGLPPDDEDERPNKKRRISVTTTEESENGPRFACPFYKHDPNRYRNRRTCPGPGWPTVHRMKEHLYRSHAQPIYCPRCYVMFDADSDLSQHLRSEPCSTLNPQPIEGIDRETSLKLHKRSPAGKLEEDKWRDVYMMLFPGVEDSDIPSPFYDCDPASEASRRFRRDLLQRVRRELFATAEQESGAVEQNLLRQVAGIIQRCEAELLNAFRSASTSTAPMISNPTSHPDRASHDLPRVVLPGNDFPPSQHRQQSQHQQDSASFETWTDFSYPPDPSQPLSQSQSQSSSQTNAHSQPPYSSQSDIPSFPENLDNLSFGFGINWFEQFHDGGGAAEGENGGDGVGGASEGLGESLGGGVAFLTPVYS